MSIQSEITRISGAKSDIADAIEEKGVSVPADTMIDDMADLILQIDTTPETQSKSITPIEEEQTVLPDDGKLLDSVTVGAISRRYVGSAITRKGAQTYYPSFGGYGIPSDTYLTGLQTIAGIRFSGGLSQANIRTGVTIKIGDTDDDGRLFNVTGTFTDESTLSDGQLPATYGTILAGYSAFINGVQVRGVIPSIQATTYTPGTANQTIRQGLYLAGNQTIIGDSNLVPANIVEGVSIFGVTGTAEQPTAMTAEQILAAVQQGWNRGG